jgi:hypothetical protein
VLKVAPKEIQIGGCVVGGRYTKQFKLWNLSEVSSRFTIELQVREAAERPLVFVPPPLPTGLQDMGDTRLQPEIEFSYEEALPGT